MNQREAETQKRVDKIFEDATIKCNEQLVKLDEIIKRTGQSQKPKSHWDISFIWNPRNWAIHKVTRFNSGNPYDSYRFGPLFIRVFR
jgi:hypothetical protein